LNKTIIVVDDEEVRNGCLDVDIVKELFVLLKTGQLNELIDRR